MNIKDSNITLHVAGMDKSISFSEKMEVGYHFTTEEWSYLQRRVTN